MSPGRPREILEILLLTPLPRSRRIFKTLQVVRDAAKLWSMRRHAKLWPPSFRRGAYWVQVTGYRLLGAPGGDKAPPEAFWIEVLPYLGRDGFLPTAASENRPWRGRRRERWW